MVKRTLQSRAWLIWGLAALFFFFEYFARVAPSVMVPDLMRAFKVGAFSLGSLSAFFYYAYVAMQIPVGTLMDRYGAHRLLTIMAAVCGLACLLFAHTSLLGSAEAARFLMGFSAAFAFVGALKLASVWFPSERFGLMAGITQALGMLGAAMGEGPVSAMVGHIGWRPTMFYIGVVLLVLAFCIGVVVRDAPQSKERRVMRETRREYGIISGLMLVLKNKQTWLNAGVVGFLYAPTAAFAELWGASYLQEIYHVHADVAASAISMIFIGWAIASPLAGWWSDRIRRRKPVIITSVLLSLLFLSVVIYVPGLSITTVYVLLFLYGCSNVAVATCYAVACESNPRAVAATSMSVANMASVIIGALFQPVIGWLLQLNWTHQYHAGVPYYAPHDFHVALLSLPACFIASLVFALILKESYLRTQ